MFQKRPEITRRLKPRAIINDGRGIGGGVPRPLNSSTSGTHPLFRECCSFQREKEDDPRARSGGEKYFLHSEILNPGRGPLAKMKKKDHKKETEERNRLGWVNRRQRSGRRRDLNVASSGGEAKMAGRTSSQFGEERVSTTRF